MSLETGRVIDPPDLEDFGQALEPAIFAPLVVELVEQLHPLGQAVDDAHGVFLAETNVDPDVGDDAGDDAPAALPTTLEDDALPLDDLIAAQLGFEDVREDLAAYAATFPPDLVPGTLIHDRRNPPPGNRTPGRPVVTPT